MKKITRQIDVFISNDNKEFFSEEECLNHENKLSNINYYSVRCNVVKKIFKGLKVRFKKEILFAVNSKNVPEYLVLDYMYYRFNSITVKSENGQIIPNFTIPKKISPEYYFEDPRIDSERIFISDVKVEGYPDNIPLNIISVKQTFIFTGIEKRCEVKYAVTTYSEEKAINEIEKNHPDFKWDKIEKFT